MSDDERPDPAKALTEGMQAVGRALSGWLEQMRPAFEQMVEIANRPEVRAAIEQAHGLLREACPCYCLCSYSHPADKGICDMNAVTTRHYDTERLGPVDVLLCAPCAVSQGVAELAAEST